MDRDEQYFSQKQPQQNHPVMKNRENNNNMNSYQLHHRRVSFNGQASNNSHGNTLQDVQQNDRHQNSSGHRVKQQRVFNSRAGNFHRKNARFHTENRLSNDQFQHPSKSDGQSRKTVLPASNLDIQSSSKMENNNFSSDHSFGPADHSTLSVRDKLSSISNGFNDFGHPSHHYMQNFPSKQYFKRQKTLISEYYLKRLYNNNDRLDIPFNLRCESQWDAVSEQIWDKFIMFRQSNATYFQKITIWCELNELLQKFPLFQHHPNWSLHLVGSTITGFGLDSSDVDMCLASNLTPHIDPRAESVATLNEIKRFLMDTGNCFRDFYLINAKVPILRFHDSTDSIEIDLNFNNCIGVRNTHLLNCYAQQDWRLQPLVIIVKLWAQHHDLNDARNGTISSYSLVLMVIHFLQFAVKPKVLPCLHVLRPDKFSLMHEITSIDVLESLNVEWKSENNRPLGELFLRFLDYYSNFDYVHNAISVRTGGTLPIEQCKIVRAPKNDPSQWNTLCIEEPFELTNTARSTYNWEIFVRIKNAFFQSWRRLNGTKDLNVLFKDPLFIKLNQPQQPPVMM